MPEIQDFAQRFQRLIEQADSADVRVPEDSALIGLAADLVPTITRLLRQGIELLSDIEVHYGVSEDGIDEPDSLSQIGLQISLEFAARDLNDVAFFARTDLRNAHEQLMAVTQKDNLMALATLCEAGLRRLRKALISVESAVYEFENREPPLRRWYDVEVSLQIRKLYWNLRRETGGHTVDPSKPLEVRLRSVLYRIVAFRELSIYPLLRVEDRIALRRLLKRMLDWLNGKERDADAGQRLWQDLAAFADILIHVSHRQELQEHDLDLVSRAYRSLFPYGQKLGSVPTKMVAELQALLGLDDELDRLILQGSEGRVADWRQPLQRIQRSLARATMPPERLDLFPE